MRLRRAFLPFLLMLSLLIPAYPARAEARWTGTSAEYTFGGMITFRARFESDVPAQAFQVFFQVEGEPNTRSSAAVLDAAGEAVLEYDLSRQPIRAFSDITYWFEAQTAGGQSHTSPQASFYYGDNRFTWQTREAPPFRVHWYAGDAAFAQSMLDVAGLGLQRVRSYLQLPAPELVDIYAYASADEMQATLLLSGQSWAAGNAAPDLSVMVVSLPPGPEQRLEMERQIPHELMHILLYEHMRSGYTNLPAWFGEGLTSLAELYPNPDYLFLLDSANEKGSLLPVASLCRTFPNSASEALLAYAEANSFTFYLYQQYGAAGLQNLIARYLEGLDCDQGVQAALGSSLADLERGWRQATFGGPPVAAATKNMLPWLILMAAVLAVPLGLMIGGLRRKGDPYAADRTGPVTRQR